MVASYANAKPSHDRYEELLRPMAELPRPPEECTAELETRIETTIAPTVGEFT